MQQMIHRVLGGIMGAALLMGLGGCAAKHMVIDARNIQPESVTDSAGLLAGTARVDITPGPGMPMGGYSMMGKRGMGYRTKLYARVVYIKPKQGKPVALVQCDLLSGSLVLHHKVAEAVAQKTDVEAAGLVIAGTHTHSGPANYYGSDFYNKFASSKQGLEAEFLGFLTERITRAVVQAYESRRPAKIATGAMEVHGVTRNRSLPAYYKNADVTGNPSAAEAVNPLLHMIRVDCLADDGTYQPAGAFSNFSIHPTAINSGNTLYNGDVFAYIEREVEWGIKQAYNTPFEPVHAAANFTHGDNTPEIPPEIDEGFIEAKRVGKMVGQAALGLFRSLDGQLKDDVPVTYFARETDVLEEPAKGDASLCKRAVVGCALTAGATTRYMPVLRKAPFFAPGWPRWVFTKGCQAEKRVVGGPFQYLILPRDEFPHMLFLQVIRISDTLLMPVPFEMCKEAGSRIASAVESQGRGAGLEGINRYVVMSCSNGYWGYVTTPEEYSLQYYEGGHTLYGPQTAAFLGETLSEMTADMAAGKQADLPQSWTFDLKTASYLLKGEAPQGQRMVVEQPAYETEGENLEACWTMTWADLPPGMLAFDRPVVSVQVKNDNGWEPLVVEGEPMDDSGYDISVLYLRTDSKTGMGQYRVNWHDPHKVSGKEFRFAIASGSGGEYIFSETFN
ncbi:MAG: neutral/alkaline non-lysosomal ceramidase N-terminal domain-containing protein [Desulfatibacillum sp.]|nr:neutral/alkaline non-lysosomal ceramidase N-terminal domain-containing protein [Desulfatibacillum sp.]